MGRKKRGAARRNNTSIRERERERERDHGTTKRIRRTVVEDHQEGTQSHVAFCSGLRSDWGYLHLHSTVRDGRRYQEEQIQKSLKLSRKFFKTLPNDSIISKHTLTSDQYIEKVFFKLLL